MKTTILLSLFLVSFVSAQSIGARAGIFKPHADLRSQSSSVYSFGLFTTLISPYETTVEFGVNYWQGKHRISFYELYWGLSPKLYSAKTATITGQIAIGFGVTNGITVYLYPQKSGNPTFQAGFRVLHFDSFLDLRYRYAKLGDTGGKNAGGWDFSIGYLLDFSPEE